MKCDCSNPECGLDPRDIKEDGEREIGSSCFVCRGSVGPPASDTMTTVCDDHLDELRAIAEQEGPFPGGCGCSGWDVYLSGERGEELQRCDECKRFEGDDDAARHVLSLLRVRRCLIERLGPLR